MSLICLEILQYKNEFEAHQKVCCIFIAINIENSDTGMVVQLSLNPAVLEMKIVHAWLVHSIFLIYVAAIKQYNLQVLIRFCSKKFSKYLIL